MVETQASVASPVKIEGVGLHSGVRATVRILPVSADHGIDFVRVDRADEPIPATHDSVQGSSFATTLARGAGNSVATVEHLLAALKGLGIDNARVEIDGPEIPILDGSARPFVERIVESGVRRLAAPRRYLALRRPIAFKQGDREILALPANSFQATYAIDFPHPAIGYQAVALRVTDDTFVSSIAAARTFCLLTEVEAMRGAGLAKGGSLENALVVGDGGVLNGSLRFPDEFVRHKVLDLIGDLALLGKPLRAHVITFKGGHRLHAGLVGSILAARSAWSVATSEDSLPDSDVARFQHLTERVVPRHVALTA